MAKIRKKSTGKWIVDYNVLGERKRPQFATKKEAVAFKRELELRPIDKLLNDDIDPSMTLQSAIQHYYDNTTSKKAKNTHTNEKLYFAKLYGYLGNCRLYEIDFAQMESFQTHLLKNLKASSVNRHFNLYKHFFRQCVLRRWIKESPCQYLRKLPEAQPKTETWSKEEVDQVLVLASDWSRDIFEFLYYTGSRPIGAAKLLWSDVDESKQVFRIRSQKGGHGELINEVPMTQPVKLILDKRRYDRSGQDKGHVFTNASGNPVSSTHISREFRRLANKAGIQGKQLYWFRHTYITELLQANTMDLLGVSKIVGHKDPKMTQKYDVREATDLKGPLEDFTAKRNLRLVN